MNDSVYIIAEAGVNHNGNVQLAREMVDAAVLAGADAIKFQTFVAEKEVIKNAPKAEYQVENDLHEDQMSMIKALELTQDEFVEIYSYCENKGIQFLSSAFDLDSMAFLFQLNLPYVKVASGEITNLPFLRYIASHNVPVLLSTGVSEINEIQKAISVLIENDLNVNDITVLQCNTAYPTPYCDVNLRAMKSMEEHLGTRVGYSDHTLGFEASIAAVALGARVLEKHFTLDKTMSGPDHKASLDVDELAQMISMIRNIEQTLGSSVKQPTNSEIPNRDIVRRSIVANRFISEGEEFTTDNIDVKRPAYGLSPLQWDEVIGRIAHKDFEKDEFISKC